MANLVPEKSLVYPLFPLCFNGCWRFGFLVNQIERSVEGGPEVLMILVMLAAEKGHLFTMVEIIC